MENEATQEAPARRVFMGNNRPSTCRGRSRRFSRSSAFISPCSPAAAPSLVGEVLGPGALIGALPNGNADGRQCAGRGIPSGLTLRVSYGHHIVMNGVRIADLKARLSEHLRSVRRGHAVTVLDRDTPVARIIPYSPDSSRLVVRRPAPGSPRLSEIPLAPRLKAGRDVVDLLLEDRRQDR